MIPNRGINSKIGNKLLCTSSASPGYKVGNTYIVVKNDKGVLCLLGEDGYYDPLTQLVSKFKDITEKETDETSFSKTKRPTTTTVGKR